MIMVTYNTMIDTLMAVGFSVITTIGSIFALFYDVIYSLEKRKLCPKISNNILLLSASELTEKIRNKQISCEDVINAYIQRVKEVNPIINAVVEDRFDLAIEEAKQYDLMLSKSNLTNTDLKLKYPLLGVPITIKESIAVKGMSHSASQVHLKNNKADRDAEIVTLIKNAGGIILLVSNTPELCVNMETHNYVTGITRNPYDSRKTPGGSSGGEAALLGCGASLIGFGSDMLGSIRVPASFCGVWGHKPSVGIVSIDNHLPSSNDNKFESVLTLGPLTRYQSDLLLSLSVLLKKDAKSLILKKSVNLHEITIYYTDEFLNSSKIEPEVRQALQKVLYYLQYQCNCKVEKITLKTSSLATTVYFKYLGFIRNFPELFENHPTGYFLEFLYYLLGKSNLSFNHILLGIFQKLFLYGPDSVFEDCKNQLEQMKIEFSQALGDNGVLLLPTHPTVATCNGHYYKKMLDYKFTSIFNILGFPATQCPVGFNAKGLPIGIQIAAITNNDLLCLKVAEEINNMCGGWVPPIFSN